MQVSQLSLQQDIASVCQTESLVQSLTVSVGLPSPLLLLSMYTTSSFLTPSHYCLNQVYDSQTYRYNMRLALLQAPHYKHKYMMHVEQIIIIIISLKSSPFISSLPPILLNSCALECVFCYTLTSNLGWSSHIHSTCSKPG